MRIADDELWNLVNGAIWRFPPPLHAAEPHGGGRIQYVLENNIENNAIEVTRWEVQFGAEIPVGPITPSEVLFAMIIEIPFNAGRDAAG